MSNDYKIYRDYYLKCKTVERFEQSLCIAQQEVDEQRKMKAYYEKKFDEAELKYELLEEKYRKLQRKHNKASKIISELKREVNICDKCVHYKNNICLLNDAIKLDPEVRVTRCIEFIEQ